MVSMFLLAALAGETAAAPEASPAPHVVAAIRDREDPELQRSELLRFRTTLCEAWKERRPQRITLIRAMTDVSVTWDIRDEKRAEGMIGSVTETVATQSAERTYDAQDLRPHEWRQ